MAVFYISAEDQDRLKEAKRRAVANMIPLETVKHMAADADSDSQGVLRGERPAALPHPQEVVLPLGWRVAISCEEQTVGPCLHVSVSTPTPKRSVPTPEAVNMLIEVLDAGKPVQFWLEEFMDNGVVGGKAVNFLIPLLVACN